MSVPPRFALPLLCMGCITGGLATPIGVGDRGATTLAPAVEEISVSAGWVSVGPAHVTDGQHVQDATGPWGVDGFDLAGFDTVVGSRMTELQRCYSERLADRSELAGDVVLHVHVTPEGRVDGSCTSSESLRDPVIMACVDRLMAEGGFPTGHAQTVDVTVPFVFRSSLPRG